MACTIYLRGLDNCLRRCHNIDISCRFPAINAGHAAIVVLMD